MMDLWDSERCIDEINATGLMTIQRADRSGFAKGAAEGFANALARNHDLYGFTRFEIKKSSFNDERDEVVVYVRAWNADEMSGKFRYWLRRDNEHWRFFDLEDLSGGQRLSRLVAGVGVQASTLAGMRMMESARVIPDVTRAAELLASWIRPKS